MDPPSYDTLSLAPPSADTEQTSPSARPQATNQQGGPSTQTQMQTQQQQTKKSLKDRWREIKAEDERRRTERIQHVSKEEADRITGLDRHREAEAKKNANAEAPRGMKSVLGFLMLS